MAPAVSALGVLVVSLDSAVNIAFPAMSQAFGAGPTSIKWVVITYVLAYALMSYVGGSLADRAGRSGSLSFLGAFQDAFRVAGAVSTLALLLSLLPPVRRG